MDGWTNGWIDGWVETEGGIHSRAVQATSRVTFLFQLLCLRLQGICTITYTLFPSLSNQSDPSLVQTNWILHWYKPIGVAR